MRYLDLAKPCSVFFVGIGGISMSGLSALLFEHGFSVSGCDRKASPRTEQLAELGIDVHCGQDCSSSIDKSISLVVYSSACKPDIPELMKAAELGIPTVKRSVLVGDIMLSYKNNYAIAGSHGKTTCTSMLGLVELEAGLDPTIEVGTVLDNIGGNHRNGGYDNMVIEACEYTDSFLDFHPTRELITNIEPEHLDYFHDIETERRSFARFAALLPEDGLLVVNSSIPDFRHLFSDVKCRIVTYNLTDSADTDYRADAVAYNEAGCASFTLVRHGEALGRISLNVPGEHNVTNAVGVCAISLESGIPFDKIQLGFAAFKGSRRRFEKKGELAGITIIDDYAHHPTEIAATIKTALRCPHKRLVAVFQPHTYSRTAQFLHEIAEALSPADITVLADIYAAREVNTFGVSSADITEILKRDFGNDSYHFSSFDEIENFLLANCCTGDLLITIGAGDIDSIADRLLGR